MKKNREIKIKESEASYKPFYQDMYAVAYVITGNERQAEEALIHAVCAFPYPDEDEFKEVFSVVREESLKIALPEKGEYFSHSGNAGDERNAITEHMLSLPENQMRIALLRYGIKLPVQKIAAVTGEKASDIKRVLIQLEGSCQRKVKNAQTAVKMLNAAAWECIQSACYAPDFNALFRAIEKRTEKNKGENVYARSLKGLVSWAVTLAFLLAAAIIIWLSIVLLDYYRETYIVPKNNEISTRTTFAEDSECPF